MIDKDFNIKIIDFGTSKILITNMDDLEINLQKSDLFSVGLTILRLAGYKINELNFEEDLLSTALKEFGIRFGT